MKAIRETRLIGAFLVMIALGMLLESHFSVPVLATISVPLFIRWFFNWDEAEYQHFQKRQNKEPQSFADD
ncbi:hypothetical protein FH947_000994 [Enterococcus faecalis]|nr:hypothetical protein [Enterococcus faecalis]